MQRSIGRVRSRTPLAAAGLMAAGFALLSACSSGSAAPSGGTPASSGGSSSTAGSSTAGSGGGASSSAAASSPANPANYPITDYVGYTGGKEGAANSALPPVYIGWINQQGGANDLAPEATKGAELSVQYINQHLGGIAGHPLKLVECVVPDTVAAAAQCGQQMANDSRVQVVAVGAVTIGNQAMEAALAPTHKPIVFGVSGSEVDVSYDPGFLLFGDSLHLEGPIATFIAQNLHAKNATIVYQDIPGASTNATVIANGLKIENVATKVVGFDPNTTNLTGPLIASGATTAGAVVALVFGDACVNFNKAVKQLNVTAPVVTNVTCISSSIIQGDGGTLPSWYYAVGSSLASDSTDPSGAAFSKVAAMYGAQSLVSDNWITVTFSQMLTLAKLLGTAGATEATAAKITSAANAFKGPLLWGPPQLVCGKYKSAPSVCNDEVQFFHFANGKFDRTQQWIGPPPGLTVPTGS